MGYTLQLGYAERLLGDIAAPIGSSGYVDVEGFEITKVRPFTGGSNVPTTPPHEDVNLQLGIEPYEYGGEADDDHEFAIKRAVDNEGLVSAEIDITTNYSPKIMAVTGIHLAWLHGHKGAEAAAPLMQLVAGLSDKGFGDYWSPTDGNIKHLAGTLLDWTFQHPDAVFYSIG